MTTNKRILLYTAVLTLLLSVTGAGAVPPRELEYAYLNTQSGYLIVGREAHFEVILPEAPAATPLSLTPTTPRTARRTTSSWALTG